VFLEAIELDTRALLNLRLPLPKTMDLVTGALSVDGKAPPRDFSSCDQLDFGHYSLIFGREATFACLKPACIWGRPPLARRFKRVGDIRNMLLHFRGRVSTNEVSELEQFAKHAARALERASTLARDVDLAAECPSV
jgi:hypothetical protein